MKNIFTTLLFFLIFTLGSTSCIAQKKALFKDHKRIVDSLLLSSPKYEPFNDETEGLYALSLAQKIAYHIGEAKALNKLGILYRTIHEEKKALESVKKAQAIFDKYGSKSDQIDVLYSLTEIYRFFNYHKEALDFGALTISLAKELRDSLVIGKVLWSTANVHLKINQKDQYFELGEKALALFKKMENVDEMAKIYTHLGRIIQDREKAIFFYDKVEKLLPRIQNPKTRNIIKSHLYSSISFLYLSEENYLQAENPTKIALQILEELGNEEGIAIMHYRLAEIYFYHYDNYPEAIKYAQKHLEYEKSIGRWYYVIPTAQFLMDIYSTAGQPKKALDYADIAMRYQDSLYWANRKNDAEDIEKAYELENKYKEVQRLEIQRRTRTFLGIGGILFLLLLASFFYYQRQLKTKHLKTQERFIQQLQSDKETIEKQNEQLANLNTTKDRLFGIIGHDLRGPLHSLQGLEEQINYLLMTSQLDRLKELSREMEDTSKYLSTTLNNLLNWSIQQMGAFPYTPEPINLRDAFQEILFLFEKNISHKGIVLETIITPSIFVYMDRNALNTIARNLLSNAIKFSKREDRILVEAQQNHKAVILSIKDQGLGMPQEQIKKITIGIISKGQEGTQGEKSTGLGWNLVKELIHQNKGTFAIDSTVGKGTLVQLNLPTVDYLTNI